MKMKTLGMLALAAAFAYGVPAFADDTTPTGTDSQATQPGSNDMTQNTGATTDSGSPSATPAPSDNTGSTNDGTADMPSGDDDY